MSSNQLGQTMSHTEQYGPDVTSKTNGTPEDTPQDPVFSVLAQFDNEPVNDDVVSPNGEKYLEIDPAVDVQKILNSGEENAVDVQPATVPSTKPAALDTPSPSPTGQENWDLLESLDSENDGTRANSTANTKTKAASPPAKKKPLGARIKSKMYQHILPISLLIGVIIGIAWPAPGVGFGTKVKESGISPTHHLAIMTIFFISGIKLSTDVIKNALTARLGIAWGLTAILFATSAIAVPLTQLITFPDISAFQRGLVVFFAMPTTISSGIVLTEQAGGNVALAVLLTVVSNFTASFTVGPMLKWLADFGDVKIEVVPIITKMCYLVLAPLVFGKMCQWFNVIKYIVKNYKQTLKLISTYCLVSLPWVTTSRAMDKGGLNSITAASIFAVLGWACAMHIFFVFLNFGMSKLLRLNEGELKAVVIQGSQKTLPMAIVVITAIDPGDPDESLMQIACIIAHLSQIVIDSFGIGFLKPKEVQEEKKEETTAGLPTDGELYKIHIVDKSAFLSKYENVSQTKLIGEHSDDVDIDDSDDGDYAGPIQRSPSYRNSMARSNTSPRPLVNDVKRHSTEWGDMQ
eukprot:m.233184 g.233184  ORF g.233184 m.233184 type:complete len:575 (-) comp33634_c2_seq1:23-1747(-)